MCAKWGLNPQPTPYLGLRSINPLLYRLSYSRLMIKNAPPVRIELTSSDRQSAILAVERRRHKNWGDYWDSNPSSSVSHTDVFPLNYNHHKYLAGREGIEPSARVLETPMLPLHHRPTKIFCFSTMCRLFRPSHLFAFTKSWFGRHLCDVLPFDYGGKGTL